jgi:D-serine deaminase-like pyridoxal phosphate-dependent protein
MFSVKQAAPRGVDSVRGPNEALIGEPESRHRLGTPALVLDVEVMESNIALMAARAKEKGYKLRPVAKIHKSVEIARHQIAAGGIGMCCSTIAECEQMVDAGISGVMLFTPVVNADKLARLAALNAQADDLIVAADSVAVVERYVEVARESGKSLQVLLDLEVGGRRTGALEEEAVYLAQRISAADGLEYVGIQGYVGHHQHIPDYDTRKMRSERLLEPLRRVLDRLGAAELPATIVSGGGTGTHDFDHEIGLFTEIQAGTYVFMDMNYRDVVLRPDDPHPFDPALLVHTTVISSSKPDYVVTDAGIKEIDGIFGIDHPMILRGAPAEAKYSLIGDDMGRIELPKARETLPIGSAIEVQPPHCYQTAVLYPWYHVVRGDILEDIWPIGAQANW